MKGYFKFYREYFDNSIINKDAEYLSIWIYLMCNAVIDDTVSIFNGKSIVLHRGQFITGRKRISVATGVSESKTQRVLKCFENEHLIEQQTNRHSRLITILSYDLDDRNEQQNEQLMNNKRTTNEQLMNTKKEYKNIRNKEYKNYCSSIRERLTEEEMSNLKNEYDNPINKIDNLLDLIDNDFNSKHKSFNDIDNPYMYVIGVAINKNYVSNKNYNNHKSELNEIAEMF